MRRICRFSCESESLVLVTRYLVTAKLSKFVNGTATVVYTSLRDPFEWWQPAYINVGALRFDQPRFQHGSVDLDLGLTSSVTAVSRSSVS